MFSKALPTLLIAALAGACAHAQNGAGDMRDAMYAGLSAPNGEYRCELQGVTGDVIRKTTNTRGPVYAHVKVVRTFQNPECKRLKSTISAPEAQWVDAKTGQKQVFSYTFFMNLCPDGSPPEDGSNSIGPDEGIPVIKDRK